LYSSNKEAVIAHGVSKLKQDAIFTVKLGCSLEQNSRKTAGKNEHPEKHD